MNCSMHLESLESFCCFRYLLQVPPDLFMMHMGAIAFQHSAAVKLVPIAFHIYFSAPMLLCPFMCTIAAIKNLIPAIRVVKGNKDVSLATFTRNSGNEAP
jgi:hypothetical protein